MSTFDEPEYDQYVQGWESDEKSVFGQSLGLKSVEKWTLSKARVSVRVRPGLAFQGLKMSTFDEPEYDHDVQGWESDE